MPRIRLLRTEKTKKPILHDAVMRALARRTAILEARLEGKRPAWIPCLDCGRPVRVASSGRIPLRCKICGKRHDSRASYAANREKIKAKQKARFEANREEIQARKRAWREANREKIKAQRRAWAEANREKKRAHARAWSEANREKIRAQQRAWGEANREKINAQARARYAKKKEP